MAKNYSEPVGAIHSIEQVAEWPTHPNGARSDGRWDPVLAAFDRLPVGGQAIKVLLDNTSEATRCATAVSGHSHRQKCTEQGWKSKSSTVKRDDGMAYCYLRKVSIKR